jgi:hypothetical protein
MNPFFAFSSKTRYDGVLMSWPFGLAAPLHCLTYHWLSRRDLVLPTLVVFGLEQYSRLKRGASGRILRFSVGFNLLPRVDLFSTLGPAFISTDRQGEWYVLSLQIAGDSHDRLYHRSFPQSGAMATSHA